MRVYPVIGALFFAAVSAQPAHAQDPFEGLESVDAPSSVDWVAKQNARTAAALTPDPDFAETKRLVQANLNASDRMPEPEIRGNQIYNFWQDAQHPRGIYRRTTLSEYRNAHPTWEIVLDLDRLAAAEGLPWVWSRIDCAVARETSCLVSLSKDGKDATVVREFDLGTRNFVPGGFTLPEAKTAVAWSNPDEIWVASTNYENGQTDSGYPNQVRRLHRGMDWKNAPVIATCPNADLGIFPVALRDDADSQPVIQRRLDFFRNQYFLVDPRSGAPRALPIDPGAKLQGASQGNYFFRLDRDWLLPNRTFGAGSLIAVRRDDFSRIETVWSPSPRVSLVSAAISAHRVRAMILDHVQGHLLDLYRANDGTWKARDLGLPLKGRLDWVTSDYAHDGLIVSFESYLNPIQFLEIGTLAGQPPYRVLKQSLARFDPRGLEVESLSARSADGTDVPYFVVHRKNLVRNGKTPTVLYGYGGFQVSMTPFYLSEEGQVWLARGGAYAVANIRGGGEFGPAWHNAAIRENRQRSFDDFIAVAEALISTGVTSPAKLGIDGGSNGGLLVGAVFTERPDLFNAVVCEMPLLDMLRFPLIGAGASWIGEYGDPRVPSDAAFLARYSPYQNVRADRKYPKVLFITSSSDDRVGPGHARKMAARMEAQGHDVLFLEKKTGGHTGASDLGSAADQDAMLWVFLYQQLMRN